MERLQDQAEIKNQLGTSSKRNTMFCLASSCLACWNYRFMHLACYLNVLVENELGTSGNVHKRKFVTPDWLFLHPCGI